MNEERSAVLTVFALIFIIVLIGLGASMGYNTGHETGFNKAMAVKSQIVCETPETPEIAKPE